MTLECKLSRPAELKWFKDEQEITADEHFDITVDGSVHKLTLKNTVLEDEAEYTVRVGDLSSKATLWIEGEIITWDIPTVCVWSYVA